MWCTFLFRLLNPFLSTLFYYETYRTLTFLGAKKNCNKQYVSLLASVVSLMIGIIQNTEKEDSTSPVCMMKLNFIEKSAVLIVHGLICTVMTVVNVKLSKHMRQTRLATGRRQTSNDRLVLARLTFYNLVMLLSLLMHCIEFLVEIKNNAVYLTTLMFQSTLGPLVFTVIFVLSTRQFKQKIRKTFLKNKLGKQGCCDLIN